MYCCLLYAVQRGYLVFVEVLAAATWLGGAIIIASTTYILRREARAARQAVE